jgi:hypothetical protein
LAEIPSSVKTLEFRLKLKGIKMKTSKHAITIEPKDFPIGNKAKQVWIKINGMQCLVFISSDGRMRISRWINKAKFPASGRIKSSTYKY